LLQLKLPLPMDRIEAALRVGDTAHRGALPAHQDFPSLAFLQLALLHLLLSLQLARVVLFRSHWDRRQGGGGLLHPPEFLLAGLVELHHLRHLTHRLRRVRGCGDRYREKKD